VIADVVVKLEDTVYQRDIRRPKLLLSRTPTQRQSQFLYAARGGKRREGYWVGRLRSDTQPRHLRKAGNKEWRCKSPCSDIADGHQRDVPLEARGEHRAVSWRALRRPRLSCWRSSASESAGLGLRCISFTAAIKVSRESRANR